MTGKELAEKIAPFLKEFIEERLQGEHYYYCEEDFDGVPEVLKAAGVGASSFRTILKLCLVQIKNYSTNLEILRVQ